MLQLKLVSGTTHMVANVADDSRIKSGVTVTLKDSDDPKRYWFVEEVYSTPTPKRGWNNNI